MIVDFVLLFLLLKGQFKESKKPILKGKQFLTNLINIQSYKDSILPKILLKTLQNKEIKSYAKKFQKLRSPIVRIGVWFMTLMSDLKKLVNFSYFVVSSTQ